MPVEVNEILHVLAHELRTPVGIVNGYVRLLLDDRLRDEAERRRALEQIQRALARLSDLSHQSTALAAWYERTDGPVQSVPVTHLIAVIADADYDWPVTVATRPAPEDACVRTADAAALGGALAALVRATARELRGATCDVQASLDDGYLTLLIGPEEQFALLAAGPSAAGASPIALERGGLGLTLIHAALVLEAHGARHWTIDGSRRTAGVRLPLEGKA